MYREAQGHTTIDRLHRNCRTEESAPVGDYAIVGITNSAPARIPVGQRVVIVFSLV